ncbi:hypothetical protein EV194_12025 [Natronoflexus pectinivorans]|uniref:Uncharacterized protein n=1 Tax=Natronoflexus pectinivorans TaxID=682526 RepID=A0A4R2G777_9BACT|nr:hypothetical protein EV194_12025 [Natronoflexus pectinivorans]
MISENKSNFYPKSKNYGISLARKALAVLELFINTLVQKNDYKFYLNHVTAFSLIGFKYSYHLIRISNSYFF